MLLSITIIIIAKVLLFLLLMSVFMSHFSRTMPGSQGLCREDLWGLLGRVGQLPFQLSSQ